MNAPRQVMIVGSGAQGRVTLDVLQAQFQGSSSPQWVFVDDNPDLWGQTVQAVRIIGGWDWIYQQDPNQWQAIVALGHPRQRQSLAQRLVQQGIALVNAIHPTAVIAASARLGWGNFIGPLAVVNAGAQIGNFTLINTAAVVEHDCVVADGVTLSSRSCLGGRVTVETGAFLCTGAMVLSRLTVGRGSLVGAASLVTKDVPERVLVLGHPARVLETIDEGFAWERVL